MGHSIGDGIIVVAIAAAIWGYYYLKFRSTQKRLELIHEERLIAIEKDIPLPELPLDPPATPNSSELDVPLLLGIILVTLSAGTMVAWYSTVSGETQKYWVWPLPFVLMGFGLMLFYYFAKKRDR